MCAGMAQRAHWEWVITRRHVSLRRSVTPSLSGGISRRRPCKKAPCTAARRAQFFPQLAVGVTWWLLLLYTPHREWWYYSLKRVGGAVGKWCMGRASSIILSLVVVNRRYYNLCCVHMRERESAPSRERICFAYFMRAAAGWTPRAVGIEVASTIILSLDNVCDTPMMSFQHYTTYADIKLGVIINYTYSKI